VSLRQPGVPITPYLTSTDPQGRYSFSGVSRGSYLVEAGSTGFVTRQYGQRPDARTGNAVDLEDGEVVERIDILLPRAPAITGTVVDEHGEPVEGASVSALRILPVDGRLTAAPSSPRPRRTDDRGEYRVFGLAPGSYLVTASIDALVAAPDGGPPRGYVPMFFPGTPDPTHAGHVTVVPGADRDGVAVVLSRTPGARIAGTALDRMGRPFKGTVALSVSERSGVIRLQPRTTEPGPGGTFAFDNVPPGDYVVQAFELSGNARQFGMQYMTVADAEPAPIVVRTSPGPTIEFRVRLEGESDDQPVPPAALPFPVDLDYSPLVGVGPSTSGMFPETIGVGRFKVTAATGPRRFVLESALEIADWYAVRQRDPELNLRRDVFAAVSESWYIKSARVNGADALDAPFDFGLADTVYRDVEIVVSPAGAAIEGRATDALDKPVADYAVVVFSVYSDYWFRNSRHLKFAPSAPDGRFLITGLPPGDYYVAAVDTLEGTAEGGEWQDRAILTQLVTRAQQITLSERERRTLALDIIRR
jgi:hypothetical protein